MNTLWKKIKNILSQELSGPNYQMLINTISPIDYKEGILTIELNGNYSKMWFKDKCEPIIIKQTKDTSYEKLLFNYIVKEEQEKKDIPQMELFKLPTKKKKPTITFKESPFTFDNYVVGNNSKFAHAAAYAVANKPAKAYNPLFLYGSVGLGKTHLINAIAQKAHENNPDLNIAIITSEHFTNELINSLKNKKTKSFKDKYRKTDMLIIDDIQFLAGKEATQEEFFHTFNELHNNTKQIILTSDRPPRDIPTLQERLRTRFSWGLVADIQPPELETRIAILKKKTEHHTNYVAEEIFHYIATQITTNIRELEGAITRIMAYASLMNTDITLDVARKAIKDMIGHEDNKVTIQYIQDTVAEYFNITRLDLLSKVRTREVAYARQIAMYLVRELTNHSLPLIGEKFGNRDHTTIMHGYEKIKKMLNEEDRTKGEINSLLTCIKGV